jgi:hypothetical protein
MDKNEYETQREYQALCDRARRAGVPTSLDDPESPRTVEGLREAVEAAEGGEWRRETLPDGSEVESYWLPGAEDPYLVRGVGQDPR